MILQWNTLDKILPEIHFNKMPFLSYLTTPNEADRVPSRKMIKHIVAQYPKLPFPNLWEIELIAINFLIAFLTIFVGWGMGSYSFDIEFNDFNLSFYLVCLPFASYSVSATFSFKSIFKLSHTCKDITLAVSLHHLMPQSFADTLSKRCTQELEHCLDQTYHIEPRTTDYSKACFSCQRIMFFRNALSCRHADTQSRRGHVAKCKVEVGFNKTLCS